MFKLSIIPCTLRPPHCFWESVHLSKIRSHILLLQRPCDPMTNVELTTMTTKRKANPRGKTMIVSHFSEW